MIILHGCSSTPGLDTLTYANYPSSVELTEVPYYPEDAYYCGPQSLAMMLSASGINAIPEALIDSLYIPDRRGSFTAEMRSSARARGRLPYLIEPRADALLDVLNDGYPVLLLQNLGLRFAPVWHYAVLIGYDRASDNFILRTGPHRRHLVKSTALLRHWQRGNNWGIVLLGPEDFPAWIQLSAYEDQLAHFENTWTTQLPGIYQRMSARWPHSQMANLGLGNQALGEGNAQDAKRYYRAVLAQAPDSIAALNNLAEAEARLGNNQEALMLGCRAFHLAQGHPLLPLVEATITSITGAKAPSCSASAS